MARPYYHDHPETLVLESEVVAALPGRVALAASPFYPGGGGQPADRGSLHWAGGEVRVRGLESAGGRLWHLLDAPLELAGRVEARVDPEFRQMLRELHTGSHVLNAVIFQAFDGALVTGVQLGEDGTARMDFGLPGADSERLRALEAPINEAIRQDLSVPCGHLALYQAYPQHRLVRARAVAPPPTTDGLIRIVEIAGLDRQACGGTHLASTGAARPLRILKVDNKGRHNRRVRFALAGFGEGAA